MRPAQILPSLVLLSSCSCSLFEGTESEELSDPSAPLSLSLMGSESCPLPDGLDPKKVSIISYQVKLEAHAQNGVPANYFYASLLTTDGARYLAEYPGCAPVLSGHPLKPGETVTGFFNFPIPPSKTPEKIEYAPQLGANEKPEIFEILLRAARNTEGAP